MTLLVTLAVGLGAPVASARTVPGTGPVSTTVTRCHAVHGVRWAPGQHRAVFFRCTVRPLR